ncbi:hypothetical protein [Mangrovibacter plantisponsor]|uniref:PD-(D/E)XK nuclease superfamily protein n=1 Tax=Mangrovibacter plantisponsor TaxID=451513 RepID=A0A317PTG0_9ENTR|nr:hypothetical protein [Mangrovibacter plantisponsor]PWW04972.1 hypothetical protein DES37_11468 [Mangrovibacter plantisponsor]
MPNYKKDGTDIKNLISDFMSVSHIKSKLGFIKNKEISDWEKWLQLELQYYIDSTEKYEVEREVNALPDKRKLKGRSHIFIDIIFRKFGTAIGQFYFVELKTNPYMSSLYSLMCEDYNKLRGVLSCEYNQRSSWFVGFYTITDQPNRPEVYNMIKQDAWEYFFNDEFQVGKNNKIGVLILGHPVRE